MKYRIIASILALLAVLAVAVICRAPSNPNPETEPQTENP